MGTARALLLVGCVLLLSMLVLAQGPAEPAPLSRAAVAPESLADAPSATLAGAAEPLLPLRRWSLPEPMYIHPMIASAPKPKPKVLDKKFFLWTGLAVGLTIADVELTQRCLHHGTCVELNPTLPTGHAAMYAANIPVTAALFYWSYRRKSKGQKLWWLPTLVDATPHAAGAIDNLRFK